MTEKWITAKEHMDRLNADPDWVARMAKRDEELAKREAEYKKAEAPLVALLRQAGHNVESSWDLLSRKGTYSDVLPLLFDHLTRDYPEAIRDGLARALGVKETKAIGWSRLIGLYKAEQSERVKDAIAIAIAEVADDDVIGDIISLVGDTSDDSRILLLRALEHSKDPNARRALLDLSEDRKLKMEVQAIFKRKERAAKRREQRQKGNKSSKV